MQSGIDRRSRVVCGAAAGWMASGAAVALLTMALIGSSACGGDADPKARLAQRGKAVFETNCIACHAKDPTRVGPIGPAVAGSTLELLESKVLRNEYPAGYTPQRDSKAMVPLAHLEPELAALHAYLEKAGADRSGTDD